MDFASEVSAGSGNEFPGTHLFRPLISPNYGSGQSHQKEEDEAEDEGDQDDGGSDRKAIAHVPDGFLYLLGFGQRSFG